MKLSLGPVPYYWPREELLAFYQGVAEAPVDIIYLGETVCSKRQTLRVEEWLELAGQLQATGKQVVLSTLSLLEAESELNTLRRLCRHGPDHGHRDRNGDQSEPVESGQPNHSVQPDDPVPSARDGKKRFMVEANDLAAINLLSGHGPFVAGPSVNIYNGRTLQLLAGLGLRRWVMPVELDRDTLAGIQQQRPAGVETEVLVFGRLPLAISARCFTARHHNLPKDDCRRICRDDPDGMLLRTQEEQPFMILNGVQLQSAQVYSLMAEMDELQQLGVDVLRISPQSRHTGRIIELFHACLRDSRGMKEAQSELARLAPVGVCNGYWHGDAGIEFRERQGAGISE